MTCIVSSVCDKLFIVAAATSARNAGGDWREAMYCKHDGSVRTARWDGFTGEMMSELVEVPEQRLEIKNSCIRQRKLIILITVAADWTI